MVKEDNPTEFYANELVAKSWSRDLLLNAIKMDTFIPLSLICNEGYQVIF